MTQNLTPMPGAGIEARLKALAAKRKLSDLSVGPVLTWTNERMQAHIDRLLQIPGAPRRASAVFGNRDVSTADLSTFIILTCCANEFSTV